ncbi:ferredoxin [Candidatus Micrarchaeota archaeon CG_4_10_14_0_2_um_filter_60_11]|nr:MAG: ferredoxin [Candidatus Micrarchaeota archaeon CG1_02_60_51]PIZ90622.1 MAG: ferredoxin [Candidatus Micrarchaeota archaeon CG_4_10_14_0_2_um_filter_60_11]
MPPIIDKSKCVGCGACVSICPAKVLELVDGKAAVVRPKDCLECRACMGACNYGAITFKD